MKWKCKESNCEWYESCNPFGSAPICKHMGYRLDRMVMVKELKSCNELKECEK